MNILRHNSRELSWYSIDEKDVVRAVRTVAEEKWRHGKILESCLSQQWWFDDHDKGADLMKR
jgi:hypothetical protein